MDIHSYGIFLISRFFFDGVWREQVIIIIFGAVQKLSCVLSSCSINNDTLSKVHSFYLSRALTKHSRFVEIESKYIKGKVSGFEPLVTEGAKNK